MREGDIVMKKVLALLLVAAALGVCALPAHAQYVTTYYGPVVSSSNYGYGLAPKVVRYPATATATTTYYAPATTTSSCCGGTTVNYAPAQPVTTYYVPATPVTTYYAPATPVTTYYAPAPVTTYYAPAVTTAYYTPTYYYT